MTRKIARSIGDLPREASVPLGCVIEDETMVVAYGEGGTFNEYGLDCISPDLQVFIVEVGGVEESVKVYAEDVGAALLWLRDRYHGPYDISVEPVNVFVGTFDAEEED